MSGERPPIRRVLVTMATYRRPVELADALDSLEALQIDRPFRVAVIDNDPDASARDRVLASPLQIEYVHEPHGGIATVRNAALDAIRPEDDAIVFVDDDEIFNVDWLETLWAYADSVSADIVVGPVITEYPPGTPRWISRGGFVQRSRMHTGVLKGKLPATNNVLFRVDYWRAAGAPRFDTAFSFTGGSDSDFFSRLIGPKDRVFWCDEAITREFLPPERRSFRWVMRRMVRVANVDGRLRLRTTSRLALIGRAIPRIGYGVLRVLGSFITGKGFRKVDVRYITLGLGWIGAATGNLIIEYRRPAGG